MDDEPSDSLTRRTQDSTTLLAELRRAGFTDERLLAAMARVSRERFVPPALKGEAWVNHALPIGAGQTISQPLVVALMTAALELRGGERVLEIGAGSGYQTAILSELVGAEGRIVSIERHAQLAADAAARLADLNYTNVAVHIGDGSLGWPDDAPYHRVIVTAAGPRVPSALLDQLGVDGGRLVMPIGDREDAQELVLIERDGHELSRRSLGQVRFVPLIGRGGWSAIREHDQPSPVREPEPEEHRELWA